MTAQSTLNEDPPASAPTSIATQINHRHAGTFAGLMGVRVLSASRDEVLAEIDVTPHLLQPYGIVHGGVHASIVETLASIGAAIDAKTYEKTAVGLENQTSFLRAARAGTLRAAGRPLTRGRRSQVWEVEIRDTKEVLVATGRVRLLVVDVEVAA